MTPYLKATKRAKIADYVEYFKENLLTAGHGSERYYDDIIEINPDTLEPHIIRPFTPNLAYPLSKFKQHVVESE